MNEKFKSSFIPKAPLVGRDKAPSKRSSGPSPLTIVASIIFTLSLLVLGGVYGYKIFVEREIDSMKAELEEASQRLEKTDISRYQRMDKRISTAEKLLSNHRVSFALFEHLEDVTMSSVQYTSFDFSVETSEQETEPTGPSIDPETGEPVPAPPPTVVTSYVLSLSGSTDTFDTVALQREQFEQSEFINSASFSNFSIGEDGNVIFEARAVIDPELLSYADYMDRAAEVEPEGAQEGASEEGGSEAEEDSQENTVEDDGNRLPAPPPVNE